MAHGSAWLWLAAALTVSAPAIGQPVSGLDGDWDGVVTAAGGLKMRLSMHVESHDGMTELAFFSVDEANARLPGTTIRRVGDAVSVDMAGTPDFFKGILSGDGKTISGALRPSARPVAFVRRAAGAPAPGPLTQDTWAVPSDAAIHQILVNRIDDAKQSVGIVVGVIDANGRRIISYGSLDQGDKRALNGDTEFEIGSITKVFTSLLLADMVERRQVALDDPAARYLPPDVKMPQRGDKQITLADLATHTSGLPRMPDNIKRVSVSNPENPFADYTVAQLYQALARVTLSHDIGTAYEYSNLGAGLLGHVLSLRAGMDYETLVRQRITAPLGMKDTVITLSPQMRARLAAGHDAALRPAENWDIPTVPGAGALRSTANDLLTFLGAELGIGDNPLKGAMAAQLAVRRRGPSAAIATALAWQVLTSSRGTTLWHSGATGGYRSFIGFSPATRIGIVVLSNAGTTAGNDDLGLHLLQGMPLASLKPYVEHVESPLDDKAKAAFVGRYLLANGVTLAVTLEDGHLFGQATGQPKIEMFPENRTQLFYKAVEAQVSFVIGPDGRAAGIVFHQAGLNVPGGRVN